MKTENQTMTTEFFIVGFSDFPHMRVPLFVIFLLIYLTTMSANILIVSLICYDSHLHTPMYFFIANLSFIDIGLSLTILPKMLANFFEERPYVTLKACLVQLYFFVALEGMEYIVITVMAYDRYVAICNPLHYTVIMTKDFCCQFSSASVIFGLIAPIPHILITSALSFCDSHQINHFFCDITELLKISCTSTQNIETLTYVIGAVIGLFAFFPTLISYFYIISIILKIHSVEGRLRGLSTCASHLSVVILFYVSVSFMYLQPPSMHSESMNQNKLYSLVNCVAVPLFNPIIYSLNSKDLRNTLRKKQNW